jgi:serine/threonine protein kinase
LTDDEKQLLDLITKALIIDPKDRITCEEAINHKWFDDIRH